MSNSPLSFALNLRQRLIKSGYPQHAHELMLVYLIEQLASHIENKKSGSAEEEKLFFSTVKHLTPSPPVKSRLQSALTNVLKRDASFRNQNTLTWLNGLPGRTLRQHVWGEDLPLHFSQILKLDPNIGILYQDLDTFAPAAKWSQLDKKFIQIVRQWILEQCVANLSLDPKSRAIVPAAPPPLTMNEALKNPQFSLFNYNWVGKMATMINMYQVSLYQDIRDPNNTLQTLIGKGCFESWTDLFGQLFNLKGLNNKDVMKIMDDVNPSPAVSINMSVACLGAKMERHLLKLHNERKMFETFLPAYQEIADSIATAGDDINGENPLKNLGWYINTLLKQCIHGSIKEIGENKLLIQPNWERAKILYEKLYKVANYEQQKKLNEMMKPIKKEKGL